MAAGDGLGRAVRHELKQAGIARLDLVAQRRALAIGRGDVARPARAAYLLARLDVGFLLLTPGTGVGAVAGGVAAGAAAGIVAGPVGTVVGAAVGAVAGGLAGKGRRRAVLQAAPVRACTPELKPSGTI